MSDLRKLAMSAVDQVFAESVRLTFYNIGTYSREEDPARPSVVITAVLRADPSRTMRLGDGIGWTSRISGEGAELHINRATYPSLEVKQGDVVTALDRPGLPSFEVRAVAARGDTRLVLTLGDL